MLHREHEPSNHRAWDLRARHLLDQGGRDSHQGDPPLKVLAVRAPSHLAPEDRPAAVPSQLRLRLAPSARAVGHRPATPTRDSARRLALSFPPRELRRRVPAHSSDPFRKDLLDRRGKPQAGRASRLVPMDLVVPLPRLAALRCDLSPHHGRRAGRFPLPLRPHTHSREHAQIRTRGDSRRIEFASYIRS